MTFSLHFLWTTLRDVLKSPTMVLNLSISVLIQFMLYILKIWNCVLKDLWFFLSLHWRYTTSIQINDFSIFLQFPLLNLPFVIMQYPSFLKHTLNHTNISPFFQLVLAWYVSFPSLLLLIFLCALCKVPLLKSTELGFQGLIWKSLSFY